MYHQIKRALLFILPSTVLTSLKPILRNTLARFYSGDKHQCNVCDCNLSRFIVNESDLLCPKCGSIGRTRFLWSYFDQISSEKSILHFSPHPKLRARFKSRFDQYTTSDFVGEFDADEQYDITNIPLSENTVDYLICMHVLEHIPNDHAAMTELFRILKPGGTAIIQTPFKAGETYEDQSVTTPEGRLRHFGQADHVRVYSVSGLADRLRAVGFAVRFKVIADLDDTKFYGLKKGSTIILAGKGEH